MDAGGEAFDAQAMGDKALINFLIHMDKLALNAQKIHPIKDGDTVLVANNMPTMRHAALHKYHLPDDYWDALAEAKKRGLI